MEKGRGEGIREFNSAKGSNWRITGGTYKDLHARAGFEEEKLGEKGGGGTLGKGLPGIKV